MSTVDGLLRRAWPVVGRSVTRLVEWALASHDLVGGEDPLLFRSMVYGDRSRLSVHPTAIVNNALFNLASGTISVGAYSFFGHNVVLLTGTHDLDRLGADRQRAVPTSGRDIVIGDGVWISSNVTVLGPCTIGDHAVVAAASLVLADVEAYSVVAGSPAVRRAEVGRPQP